MTHNPKLFSTSQVYGKTSRQFEKYFQSKFLEKKLNLKLSTDKQQMNELFSTANQRIIFLPKTLLRSSVQNCWDFLTQTCGVEKSGRGLIIILAKEDHFQDEQASKLMMNRQIGLEFEKMQEMKVVLQQQNLLNVDSSILAHFSIWYQNRNSLKETKIKEVQIARLNY